MMIIKKILYLLIIFGLFLFLTFYARYFPVVIFIQVISLPVVLFIILFFMKRGIKIEFEDSKAYYTKGERIDISFNLINKSIFPISRLDIKVLFKNSFSGSIENKIIRTNINSKDKVMINFGIDSKYFGEYTILIKEIKVFDYFSLFSMKKRKLADNKKYVLPNLHELSMAKYTESLLGMESDLFSEHKSGDDPSEVFQVREYLEGDKIQRIHWKLSSKFEKIMVKEFSLPISKGVCILIEYYRNNMENNYKVFESLNEGAFSTCNFLISNNIEHNVFLYDYDSKNMVKYEIKSKDDLEVVLKESMKLRTYNDENNLIYKFNNSDVIKNYSKVIYFTSNIDEKTSAQLNILINNLVDIKTMLFIENTDNEISIENNNSKTVIIDSDNMLDSMKKIIL